MENDFGRVGCAETGSRRSDEAPAGLRPSGYDPERSFGPSGYRRTDNELQDVVTVEFRSGERVNFAGCMVRGLGMAECLRRVGYEAPAGRTPVYQHGEQVGTVPAAFDPLAIRSSNWLYQPRAGDFVLRGERWEAADTLGPGDLEAVPGFVWEAIATATRSAETGNTDSARKGEGAGRRHRPRRQA